jgi:divalent metal cation (Fe/Co/Zn/Cd) transporter
MRVEAIILLFLGVFFGIVGLVYWFWSLEVAGSVMLAGTAALGFLPGGYYYYWHRRMGKRVEDREDASIAEGAGEIDSFPGSSIWPFVMGMGAFLTVLSLVFGIWLILPGITLIVTALVGVTAESRRGGHV